VEVGLLVGLDLLQPLERQPMGAAQVEAEVRQETQEILIQAAVAVLALIVEAHGAMVH
jgi:hypothetical protein